MVLGACFKMEKKIPRTIGNQILPLKYGFGIGYGIGQKYQPIWVWISVLDLNQNSSFGRTLHSCNNASSEMVSTSQSIIYYVFVKIVATDVFWGHETVCNMA